MRFIIIVPRLNLKSSKVKASYHWVKKEEIFKNNYSRVETSVYSTVSTIIDNDYNI